MTARAAPAMLILLSLAAACAHKPPGVTVPVGPAEFEALWQATLLTYKKRTYPNEGDRVVADRHRRDGEPVVSLILVRRAGSPFPFRDEWVDSLVARGTIRGTCVPAPGEASCSRTEPALFVELSRPWGTSKNGMVGVHEEAVAPGVCLPSGDRVREADLRLEFTREELGWQLQRSQGRRSRRLPCRHAARP